MATSFRDFIKSNTKFAYSGGGLPFAAMDIKSILDSDNKFKAILKTFKDLVLIKVAMIGTFSAIGAAIRSLVKDTGSLDAALKRLSQVQHFTRAFTPLIGSAREARRHVASLLDFASRTPFKFENVAQADKTLRSFVGTGVMLKTVGDAAAKSGNGIDVSAEAVADFYQKLQNGEPIGQAVSQLSQMGLISSESSKSLQRLSTSGADTVEMANNLTAALEASRGGMASLSQDVDAVADAHEKASESAKAAFGEAFAQSDVQNTKNYTAALVALTPAIRSAGQTLATMFNGLSTATSWLSKLAAESGLASAAIRIVTAVISVGAVALTAWGISAIPTFIGAISSATAALGIFGTAITAIAGATVIGAAVIAITAITVAGANFVRSTVDMIKSVRELTKAHREAQAAIDAQSGAIETLADRHEALAKAQERVLALQKELNDEEVKNKDKSVWRLPIKGEVEDVTDFFKRKETRRAKSEAEKKLKDESGRGAEGLSSPEREAAQEKALELKLSKERQDVEEKVRRSPGSAPEILAGRIKQLESRSGGGLAGIEARVKIAESRSNLDARRIVEETSLRELEADKASGKIGRSFRHPIKGTIDAQIQGAKNQLNKTDAEILAKGLTAPSGSAVNLETRARQLEAAVRAQAAEKRGDKEESARQRALAGGVTAGPNAGQQLQDLQIQARQASKFEVESTRDREESIRLKGQVAEQERDRAVERSRQDTEIRQHEAQRGGRFRESIALQDFGKFAEKFEQNRRLFDPKEAAERAYRSTADEIAESARTRPAVVSSLQEVGGGGNIGASDPSLEVARRQAELQRQMVMYLSMIAGQSGGTPESIPTFR